MSAVEGIKNIVIKVASAAIYFVGGMFFFMAILPILAAMTSKTQESSPSLLFAVVPFGLGAFAFYIRPKVLAMLARSFETSGGALQRGGDALKKAEIRVATMAKQASVRVEEAARSANMKMELLQNQRNELISKRKDIADRSIVGALKVHVLGGAGCEYAFAKDALLTLSEQNIFLNLEPDYSEFVFPIQRFQVIEITGPGVVVEGGGFAGGGFGVDGFIQGAALATLLNVLTTRKSTKTIVRLGFDDSELILLSSDLDPTQMRVQLSRLFLLQTQTREQGKLMASNNPSGDISNQLKTLADLHRQGALTGEEFERAKSRLLS